jgi:hypothetical protein
MMPILDNVASHSIKLRSEYEMIIPHASSSNDPWRFDELQWLTTRS